jgi:hypothetical protein
MFKKIFVAAWLAVAVVLPASATSVLPLDLGQIIDMSAIAFQGTVVDVKTGKDPQTGMLVTLTTFRVDDVLKGDVPASYTIKQIGGEDAATGMKFKGFGVPTYAVGGSYVLFMNGVSSAGFTSPVGLQQGRFQIVDGDAVSKSPMASTSATSPPRPISRCRRKRRRRTRARRCTASGSATSRRWFASTREPSNETATPARFRGHCHRGGIRRECGWPAQRLRERFRDQISRRGQRHAPIRHGQSRRLLEGDCRQHRQYGDQYLDERPDRHDHPYARRRSRN